MSSLEHSKRNTDISKTYVNNDCKTLPHHLEGSVTVTSSDSYLEKVILIYLKIKRFSFSLSLSKHLNCCFRYSKTLGVKLLMTIRYIIYFLFGYWYNYKLNSVVRQPVRTMACCAQPSLRKHGPWDHTEIVPVRWSVWLTISLMVSV